jgi:hypothetical protein
MTTEQQEIEAPAGSDLPVPRPIRGDVITAYEAMLAEVPDAGNEGIEGILEQIATATSAQELDEPWRAGGLGKYVDVPLVVTGIRKMPSDFGSGLAFFLVVDGAVRATGEKVAVTTGSVSVVAQLVKAWSLNAFPLLVVPRLAKRPTKDGYYPQHLEIVGA